jgi:HEAT repeat-containing protein 5
MEPVVGALEHDPNDLYKYAGETIEIPAPAPSRTALVDSAIDLFAQTLFDQPVKIQESAVSQIATSLSESALARNFGRRTAVRTNTVIALSKAMFNLGPRATNSVTQSERLNSSLVEVLHVFSSDFLYLY